jgi:four helix bundle protein
MYPFQRLIVWRRAHQLSLALFRDKFPSGDVRARVLVGQTWRATTSIGANLAEGAGSATAAQFARYIGLAIASACELENHLLLATDAGLLDKAVGDERLGEVGEIKRMLWALRQRVQSRISKRRPA